MDRNLNEGNNLKGKRNQLEHLHSEYIGLLGITQGKLVKR